jgi:hypothetical protein
MSTSTPRRRPGEPVLALCTNCGNSFPLTDTARIYVWRKTGRAACSAECRAELRGRGMREYLKRNPEYRDILAQRCREVINPLGHTPEARAKAAATRRRNGTYAMLNGGNGRPLPEPQRRLAELLGWPTEFIVPTGQHVKRGPPSHYKLDIANPAVKVAVEVDGWLGGAGWIVLRFTNQDVLADTAACARTVMAAALQLLDTDDKISDLATA